MSTGYLISLAASFAIVLGARFVFASLPLRRVATPMTIGDAIFAVAGIVGLLFHCGAMFFRSAVSVLPGTHTLIHGIDAMGTFSIIWYVVAAALLLLGLRHQHPIMVVAMVLALTGVGTTMYDGASLQVHLASIFIFVVTLAGIAAIAVLPPWRHGLEVNRS